MELTLLDDIEVGKGGIVDSFGVDVVQVYDRFYNNPRFPYENMERVCGCKTLTRLEERFLNQSVDVYYDEWKSVQLMKLCDVSELKNDGE